MLRHLPRLNRLRHMACEFVGLTVQPSVQTSDSLCPSGREKPAQLSLLAPKPPLRTSVLFQKQTELPNLFKPVLTAQTQV